MNSKYRRTPSLDKFVELLYSVAQKALTSKEPDFMRAFRNALAVGESADVVIEHSKHLIKDAIPEWVNLLWKTYEVELCFVKLGHGVMFLSIDPPKGLTGLQPLSSREFFQYSMDSYFHALYSLIDRLKGLVRYLRRNFIPQVYPSSDRNLILKEQSILEEIETRIEKFKTSVKKIRDPMAHYLTPGVEALEEERHWYTYLALPERLDLVESYYSFVNERRLYRTQMLTGVTDKTSAFVEDAFKRMLSLSFLHNS